MEKINQALNNFLKSGDENSEYCDPNTGVCYIKKNGEITEKKFINRKVITEDGRQLLKEELPISRSDNNFLR